MAKHILFVGGGTSGHIAPLLAVMAEVYIQAPDTTCSYVGLQSDVESPIITQSNLIFSSYSIQAGKLNRYITLKQFREAYKTIKGYGEAYSLLKKLKPDCIFSKGGFVSIPIVFAASRLHIPVISHETDSIPGLANRLVARSAKVICTAFPPDAYRALPRKKMVYTGQPVRSIFYEKQRDVSPILGREFSKDVPIITVTGGSQGARRINTFVQENWVSILNEAQLVQQCGALDYERIHQAASELPPELQERLWLVPTLGTELAALFQLSSVVISRAGGTIAELAASHACTMVIPLSTSSQNHQAANAAILQKAKAAVCLDETSTSNEAFGEALQALLHDVSAQHRMRDAIGALSKPHAAHDIAQILLG